MRRHASGSTRDRAAVPERAGADQTLLEFHTMLKQRFLASAVKLVVATLFLPACMPARAADAAGDLASALGRDSEVTLHLRTYYFDRLNPGSVQNAAWAVGGWLGYQTGWIGNVLRLGLVGYTSQPLWAPSDKDGSGLLAPQQAGYSALGEAFAAVKLWDQSLTVGRFLVNEPEINPHDVRMTPITYQGGSLGGSLAGVSYYGAYLGATKPRTNEDFIDFVQAAKIAASDSEPLWLLGVAGDPVKNLRLRLSSYYVPNVLSSTYADATWLTKFSDHYKLRLGAQTMYQKSVGSDLLTGSPFSTTSNGIKIDAMPGAATLSLAYQQTGRGSNYNTPYAGWAGYTSMIVKDFNRAGQKAWLVGASYDFAALRLPGVAVNGAIVNSRGAIDASSGAPLSDWTEYDLTADWRLSAASWPEWARPLWIRARAARVDMGTDGVVNDYRIIVNYEYTFK